MHKLVIVLGIHRILGFARFIRFLGALIRFRSIIVPIIIALLIILILFTIHIRSDSCCKNAKNIIESHASKRDTTE